MAHESLADLLKTRIRMIGPMTLAEYMAECLLHPRFGYYATRDPFGTEGDFTTAPEISQMFGELLGLCLAQYWLDIGRPASFTLAELGPGRGTLMADVLRATRRVPGFHEAAEVILVEASPVLRQLQRESLGQHPARWLDSVIDLPDAPLFLLANEFFDALPIRQFSRQGDLWAETMVGLKDEDLVLGRAAPAAIDLLEPRLADVPEGGVVEICPAATPIMAEIAARITRQGGLALILDYGGWQSHGDTFQALQAHAFADPLAEPGEADLTAHVDFAALARAARPAATAFTTQGQLLEALGIGARAERLASNLTGAALEAHLAALRRLTRPEEMGTLFKALAVCPPNAPLPAGFA